MIATIIIISIALAWLTFETDYFRVRLTGADLPPFPDRWFSIFDLSPYEIKRFSPTEAIYTEALPKYGYTYVGTLKQFRNHNNHHVIFLSPNVAEPLCGDDWVKEHWQGQDNYKPELYLAIGGVRYNMNIKQPSIIKEIMRVNRLSKKEKILYST